LRPPEDVTLVGIESAVLSKDREEILEKKGYSFARGNTVPGRFGASISAIRAYDMAMQALKWTRWGVLRTSAVPGFLCPDRPNNELYIPVSPKIAFIAGHVDRELGAETVSELNRSAVNQALEYTFGHPTDVTAFSIQGESNIEDKTS
jgi:hypothetical protein